MACLTQRVIGLDECMRLEREALARGSGALVSFAGIVRPDRRPDGRGVAALFYDAYVEMAEAQVENLAAQAKAQWAVDAVQVRHRLGWVYVGQTGVLILVAGRHRDEAYAASRFLIERIKHDVPIWKREHYDDGTSQWVACARSLHAYV